MTKHGGYLEPEYGSWHAMLARTQHPDHNSFSRYGGRGIAVDPRWMDFRAFLLDMGPRPSPRHSIDRIKNDLGYCKSNCQWSTKKQQSRNRSNNLHLTFRGETMLLCEWIQKLGLNKSTIQCRLRRGWTIDQALSYPAKGPGFKLARALKLTSFTETQPTRPLPA
jgi:hypothetical protein